MANLTQVTARARTRGKNPTEFTYQAIGKLVPRKVTASDGNAMLFNDKGEQVKYLDDKGELLTDSGVKEETAKNEKGEEVKTGNYILPAGWRFVEVDDVDVSEVIPASSGKNDKGEEVPYQVTEEDIASVMNLYNGNMRNLLIGAIASYNESARSAATPRKEVAPDELQPFVDKLITSGFLSKDKETNWRRSVTTGSKAIEMEAKDFAVKTKEWKAMEKAGKAA